MLTVDELMTSDPDVINASDSIKQAIVLMNKAQRRQLPVVDDGKLVGIISDRDIRLAVNSPYVPMESREKLELLDRILVRSCMTADPLTVNIGTPIYEVAGILVSHRFGALPVIEDGELVGIITVTDLLEQMALLPETQ